MFRKMLLPFLSVLLTSVFILMINTPSLKAGTIHSLTGTVTITGYGAPANGTVTFNCYLKDYPGDILTESSLGCSYADGVYVVQVGNFSNNWTPNHKDIHIDLWESAGGGSTSGEMTLDDSGPGFDQLNLTITNSSLPVELSAFSAKPKNNGILVLWTTQSEVDNRGYILDRKSEGLNWAAIASYMTHTALLGQGNTSSRTDYEYLDITALPGIVYQYRLSDVSTSGEITAIDVLEVQLPESPDFTLMDPPSPNPFNPTTKISYRLASESPVEIIAYDLLGNPVRTLVNEKQPAGNYNVYWHGQNDQGLQVASGTYYLILRTPEGIQSQKALMIR